MNCFYHPGVPAVGICKSCSRGICASCAADLDKGIACGNRCEEHATAVIKLIDDNIARSAISNQLIDNAKKNRYLGSAFQIGVGLFFLGFGSYEIFTTGFESIDLFLPGLGALFLFFGLFSLYRALTFARTKD